MRLRRHIAWIVKENMQIKQLLEIECLTDQWAKYCKWIIGVLIYWQHLFEITFPFCTKPHCKSTSLTRRTRKSKETRKPCWREKLWNYRQRRARQRRYRRMYDDNVLWKAPFEGFLSFYRRRTKELNKLLCVECPWLREGKKYEQNLK